MKYIKAKWKHNLTDEPVYIYGELDDANNEMRKIEVWGDGHMGYASESATFGGSVLSEKPWPSFHEIKQNAEFEAEEILSGEFEHIWQQATTQKT